MKATFRRLIRPIIEFQAKRLIASKHLTVVAVAGSVGKTSTKQAIATVLRQKYRVLVHRGNYNDTMSVPLAVFNLQVPNPIWNPFGWIAVMLLMEYTIWRRYAYEVVVLELGTDHPGELPHFMTYLKPDISVVTAVAPEHMENFADLAAVAAEELAVAKGSKKLVINTDSIAAKYQKQYLAGHEATITYGEAGVVHWKPGDHLALGKDTIKVLPQVLGDHSRQALLSAATVARELGLSPGEIMAGVDAVRPVAGRMNPLPGINGSFIIDDTYNSSPEAAVAALEVLSQSKTGRHIAILGSMNELGADSPQYHQAVGTAAAGVDLLVTIGDLANSNLGPAALVAGLDPTKWVPADSPYAAGKHVALIVKTGDVVLAKGSQNGVFAEEAVKLLLADPADAAKLVRQSTAWARTKAAQFPNA